ncbi:MAG: hypothetical protein NTU62_11805 [Spirochaetes bacterium]|nr:hypothetical protein [Spirochaetota bacterium]
MKKTGDHSARTCLERIPEGVPLGRAACGKALEAALAAPSLDERTACSRLLWLLDPRNPEGLRLAEEVPGLTPEDLARHIVHPREAVLGIIRKRTGLDAGFLERVYDCLRAPGKTPDRLADLPEERILQEAARHRQRGLRAHEGFRGFARGHRDALGAPAALPRSRGGDRARLRR